MRPATGRFTGEIKTTPPSRRTTTVREHDDTHNHHRPATRGHKHIHNTQHHGPHRKKHGEARPQKHISTHGSHGARLQDKMTSNGTSRNGDLPRRVRPLAAGQLLRRHPPPTRERYARAPNRGHQTSPTRSARRHMEPIEESSAGALGARPRGDRRRGARSPISRIRRGSRVWGAQAEAQAETQRTGGQAWEW